MATSRTSLGIALGTILGALAGCLPAVAYFFSFSVSERKDAQFGLGLVFVVVIGASLGTVAGLIAGVIYIAKQRLLTAACPCLGLVAGCIVAVTTFDGTILRLWLAPATGGLLGVFITTLTWRRVVSAQSSRLNSQRRSGGC